MASTLRFTDADLESFPDALDDTRYELIAGSCRWRTSPTGSIDSSILPSEQPCTSGVAQPASAWQTSRPG